MLPPFVGSKRLLALASIVSDLFLYQYSPLKHAAFLFFSPLRLFLTDHFHCSQVIKDQVISYTSLLATLISDRTSKKTAAIHGFLQLHKWINHFNLSCVCRASVKVSSALLINHSATMCIDVLTHEIRDPDDPCENCAGKGWTKLPCDCCNPKGFLLKPLQSPQMVQSKKLNSKRETSDSDRRIEVDEEGNAKG